MSEQEYKNAPVSEVIFGVTFNHQVIDVEALFELRQIFKDEFPILELKNPLSDAYLEESKLVTEIEVDRVGPFRLRMRSTSSDWLIQMQLNKIYFNWIRKDSDEVGNYPGYNKIKERFKSILRIVLEESNTMKRDVDYFDLTYHDRLLWQNYVDSLNNVDEIINLVVPKINTEEDFNNLINKYTYHAPSLDGYGILNLNTNTSIENQQILKFEKILRGYDKFENLENWFNKAHEQQLRAFKNTFTEKILEQWR